ncbi:hypothetical protein [Streptomyces sp. KLOTTS4A1]|uniref:hypothetical protein n=1 Tax=Streptomyces sp. KLOTTS4A1 TaxID=3390996 RepID=UPI0039F4FA19
MTVRDEAHRLLDALPEDRLLDAIELLREWTEVERGERPRRRFRTTASFDGAPDLGARAKEIVREAWDGQERHTA